LFRKALFRKALFRKALFRKALFRKALDQALSVFGWALRLGIIWMAARFRAALFCFNTKGENFPASGCEPYENKARPSGIKVEFN
jgi:hypothetical protein